MDYSKFRSSSVQGEAVGVNHKALITRALTKYPVDYALFRELLQNSADARSNSAVIQLETTRSDISGSQLHDAPITRLRFMNDGLDFTADDWARLREIASGNPNETKIGAFGVGFYSVFELTDEPLLHSGNQIMSFKYHGVQLHYYFTEKAPTYQRGTLIDLPYREEQSLPDLVKFIGFLVQSFILVNLNEIRFELKHGNQITKLLHLKKQIASPEVLPMPPTFQSKSPNRTLNMAKLERRMIRVTIEYLNSTQMPPLSLSKGFFSFGKQLVNSLMTTSTDPNEYTTMECNLTKADAFVDVSVSSSFRKKMVETLLKPPPKQAVMSLISFPGKKFLPQKSQLTSYMFPNDYNDAKIFIGFATKQSTGLKSHLALNQVIPTMERTAVDMSNQFVKQWNGEMLYMGGVMARCVYEYELSKFQSLGEEGMEDALFVCSRFRLGKSAPDALVGLYVREGFWKCARETLVPSTQGILPSNKVRLPADAAEVLRITPVVTEKGLSKELEELQYVKTITLGEICNDIASSPLTTDEFVKVIEWLVKKWPHLDATSRSKFLTAITVQPANGPSYNLGSVACYHDHSLYPEEDLASTLPRQCLPSSLADVAGLKNLQALGIRSLRLPTWIGSRVSLLVNSKSADAEKMALSLLHVTGRAWPRLSSSERQESIRLFNSVKCIPTQQGLKLPTESYAQQIKLFPNLPVVSSRVDVSRIWLLEIGVRQSMDMEFVLHALESHELIWTNEDLVQYLCDNQSSLKPADWTVLKEGPFFTKRGDNSKHYRASELFAPNNDLVQLGLPVLKYPAWTDLSKEALLLFKIGLKHFPRASVLFENNNSNNSKEAALTYFVTNYESARYSPKDIAEFNVIPTVDRGEYVKPSKCFRDPELSYFGEKVISQKWEAFSGRLGVRERPSMQYLMQRIFQEREKYLKTQSQCNILFAYFSKHMGEFSDSDVQKYKSLPFIPLYNKDGSFREWQVPSRVFFLSKTKDGDLDDLRSLLDMINPSPSAVPFLHLIGVRDKPSLPQVVEMMIENPLRVFEALDSETYKDILITIDSKWASIERHPKLIAGLKQAPVLLGVSYPRNEKGDDKKANGAVSLHKASEIAIVDDVITFNQFRNYIVTAPQDDSIERLYSRLGVRYLSQTLKESVQIGSAIQDQEKSMQIEKRINERLRLFLDNTSKQVKKQSGSIHVSLVRSLQLQRNLYPYASITVSKSALMHPRDPGVILIVPGQEIEWIDVAVALSKAVLVKPDQDSVVVLETQLSSDLSSLERKGYNVERLRQQGLKDLERKQPKIQFQEEELSGSPRSPVQRVPDKPVGPPKAPPRAPPAAPLPGSWPTLNEPLLTPQSERGQKELTSKEDSLIRENAAQPPNDSVAAAPPPNGNKRKGLFSQVKNLIPQSLGIHQTNTQQNTQDSLKAALQKGLSYDASHLHGPQNVDAPAPPVSESGCYRKVHDLNLLTSLANGVKVFATKERPQPNQDELVLSESLLLLASIFGYSPSAVHLYRDNDTSTIAFNQNGSLFFNSCVIPDGALVLDYYYPVLAHELAHNLVSSHGAAHSFYTEAYIQNSVAEFSRYRANS